MAARHQPPKQLQQLFQVAEYVSLESVTAFGILGHRLHLGERPFPLPLVDCLPQPDRAAEVAMRQEFDLAHAQILAGHGLHEPLDLA